MELAKGVVLDFKEGKIVLEADVKGLLMPVLEEVKSKVEAGDIDLIKGTDLDKNAIVGALELLKGYISK